jgi:hypothetical protein
MARSARTWRVGRSRRFGVQCECITARGRHLHFTIHTCLSLMTALAAFLASAKLRQLQLHGSARLLWLRLSSLSTNLHTRDGPGAGPRGHGVKSTPGLNCA